jgi:hypothetical protein
MGNLQRLIAEQYMWLMSTRCSALLRCAQKIAHHATDQCRRWKLQCMLLILLNLDTRRCTIAGMRRAVM